LKGAEENLRFGFEIVNSDELYTKENDTQLGNIASVVKNVGHVM
jgi:hypothetical protein